MTEKQIRKALLQARNTYEKIRHIREHKAVLESNRLKVTASYSMAGGGGGGATSKIEELTVKLLEVEEQLRLQTEEYVACLRFAENLIALLNDERHEYAAVLRMQYIDGLSRKRIAKVMNYSRVQLWRLQNKAVEILVEKTNTLEKKQKIKR